MDAKEKIQLRVKRLRKAYPELEGLSDQYLLRYEKVIKQERSRVNRMITKRVKTLEEK